MSRKPSNVTVTNASKLIVPATSPAAADILEWEASTAYSYGQIVEGANVALYWCVVAGDSGSAAPSHDNGDAADGTVTWRRLWPIRNALTVVNAGTAAVCLGLGVAAESQKGIRLSANGGSMEWEGKRTPQGAIYAIAESAGSHVVTVQEE